ASLPFKVRPGPDQAAALIGKLRQFDLKLALARPCPFAEDLENEPRAVDHLAVPGAFEIALLDRRERRIDDDKTDLLGGNQLAKGFDSAAAEESRRPPMAEPDDFPMHHLEVDRGRKAHRLGQARLGRPIRPPLVPKYRAKDERTVGRGRCRSFRSFTRVARTAQCLSL